MISDPLPIGSCTKYLTMFPTLPEDIFSQIQLILEPTSAMYMYVEHPLAVRVDWL